MKDFALIAIPAACLFTAVFIGVAACVVGGRSDDLLDVSGSTPQEPPTGRADRSRTTVRPARHLHAVTYTDGSTDEFSRSLDVIADALAVRAAPTDESAAPGDAPDAA